MAARLMKNGERCGAGLADIPEMFVANFLGNLSITQLRFLGLGGRGRPVGGRESFTLAAEGKGLPSSMGCSDRKRGGQECLLCDYRRRAAHPCIVAYRYGTAHKYNMTAHRLHVGLQLHSFEICWWAIHRHVYLASQVNKFEVCIGYCH